MGRYILTTSSLLPVFGRMVDMLGRKTIFSLGFLIFTIGSILCSLAANIWFLVGTRVLQQAIGAFMLLAMGIALVGAVISFNRKNYVIDQKKVS